MRQEVMAENLPPESFIPLPTSGNLINASAWPEEYILLARQIYLDGMMDGSPGCSAHNQVRGHFFRESAKIQKDKN